MSDNKPIQSQPADPELKKWHEFLQQEQKDTPKRLEEAAKTLTGIISLTLTLFLVVGSIKIEEGAGGIVFAAIILWLVSALASFLAIFPFPYLYKQGQPASFIHVHKKIVRRKYALLIISSALYLAALAMLSWVVFLRP
jgi:hypothetical protein